MATTPTTFAALKNAADSPNQVRKLGEAVAFLAPASAPAITSITGTDGSINTLPEGYFPVGLVTKDGYVFGGDTETEAVEALGYSAPVREDIVSATRTVAFSVYESMRAQILSLAYSMDLSTVKQAVSGEVTFDRPALPEKRYYRLVVIGKDGSGADEIFRAKFLPKVSITSIPEEAWGSEALSLEIQLSAYVDDALGTAEREFIAGPGAKKDKLELGFTQAP